MDLESLVIGAIVMIFVIIKTIKDGKQKSHEKPHLSRVREVMPTPITEGPRSISEEMPKPQKTNKQNLRNEGESSLNLKNDSAMTAPKAVQKRKSSALRTAFINTEILNRKF